MGKTIPEEVRIKQIQSIKNISFVRWENGFIGQKSKAVMLCNIDGYTWTARVKDLIKGSGCPQCAGKRPWRSIDREAQIADIGGMDFVCWPDGYKTAKSKATVRCRMDGHEWSASVDSLINAGSRCPECAGNIKRNERFYLDRICGDGRFRFIRFEGKFENVESRVYVSCRECGFRWCASINSILNGRRTGCPRCANQERPSMAEREAQINASGSVSFVRWDGEFSGAKSRAVISCNECLYSWSSSVNNIVNHDRGCPSCAKTGYDKSKTGHLYALRSECGRYVKIGISNNPEKRIAKLKLSTPFGLSLVEQINGDGGKIAELEKYFHNKYDMAGLCGFDGCTEWLTVNDELMIEIREMGR